MKHRRRGESGFALLLVFLMAAILALSLYKEIPRVAFDSQRQKEELLVERGEQYKRALQVYTRAFSHYPSKIEDLENTNNRHFLRRRYLDPMTGTDEWRLIHMQNGVLIDSKVKKPEQQQQKDTTTAIGQTVGQVAGLGFQNTTGTNQAGAANPAARRRDSDSLAPGVGAGNPNYPGADTTATGQPGAPTIPGTPGTTGVPGMPPGMGQQPGQPNPTQFAGSGMPGMGGVPGMPGTSGTSTSGTSTSGSGGSGSGYLGGGGSYLGGGGSYLSGSGSTTPGTTGVIQPGYPPGTPVNSQTGGVSAMPGSPYSTQSGAMNPGPAIQQPGITTPGFQPPGLQQAASAPTGSQQPAMPGGQNLAGLLGLTGPRPGGPPTGNTNGMTTMGGGIAGFASKADEQSIMVYNDQKNYGLWEFVFDPTKVPPLPNPLTGTVGTPAGSQIGTPATQVGTPAGQMGSSTSNFGTSSGFGTSPGGFGNTPGAPGASPGGSFGPPPPNPQPPPPE